MKYSRGVALSAIGAAVLAPLTTRAENAAQSATLRQPVWVTIDGEPEVGSLTYVYYVPEEQAQCARSTRVGERMVVDTDSNGELVGIELLDLDAATLRAAHHAAAMHGAAFPAYLVPVA